MLSRVVFHESRTLHVGGMSSGTCHLLLQWWHVSVSGLRSLPQLAQVTRIIPSLVSLYVMYPARPKARVRTAQKLRRLLESPTAVVSFSSGYTQQASSRLLSCFFARWDRARALCGVIRVSDAICV